MSLELHVTNPHVLVLTLLLCAILGALIGIAVAKLVKWKGW